MAKKSYQQEDHTTINAEEPPIAYHVSAPSEIISYGLNPAQLQLLKMFSTVKSDETFQDLKKVLHDFLAQQIEKEADKLWDDGKINYEILNEHLRTPYK